MKVRNTDQPKYSFKWRNANIRKGFTLVELIVVLVILAVLAAVIIPMMVGFSTDAKEKKYVEEAKSAMAAAETMLSDAYTNNLVYIPKRMRDQALTTSGLDSDTELTIFTVKSFKEADGTANTISSYTIAEALYKAKDGTYVYYDGKEWKIIEANDPIVSGAKDRDTYIKVWKADMTDSAGNSIHGGGGDPQSGEPIVVIDNEDREDGHGEAIDERESEKPEVHTTLILNLEGVTGKVIFPDGGYELQAIYDVEKETFNVNVDSTGWVDRWYDATTLKWVCDDLTEDEQKCSLNDIANVLKQKVPVGTTATYTLKAEVDEKTVTIPVTFAAKSSKLNVKVQNETDNQVDLKYGLKTQSILTSFDMSAVTTTPNVTLPAADNGAVTFSGSWAVKRSETYVMQGDDYKLVGNSAVKEDVENWAKATITDPTSVTEKTTLEAGVTYEALADTNKTLLVRGTLTSDDKPDKKVKFVTDGSSEDVEYSFDISYAQTELSDAVCEVSAQGEKSLPIDLSDAGTYSVFTSAGLQAEYQPMKLKYWNVYESHKNGELIDKDPEVQSREKDYSKELVKRLFNSIYFGEVAELDVSMATTKFIVTDSGQTVLRARLLGLVGNDATKIHEIRYIEHDSRAAKDAIDKEVCLSTTHVSESGNYLERDTEGEYVVDSIDPNYPAYTVAYTLKNADGVIYVVTEEDSDIMAEKSLRCFFEAFNQMTANSMIGHVDTSEVTDMSYMFKNCGVLSSAITLRTDKATAMVEMFRNAAGITRVDLNAVEENTTLNNVSNMFNGASGLTHVSLTNVNCPSLTSVNSLLNGKPSLTEIDLTGFHTENIQDFGGWLQNCPQLNKITGPYSTLPAAESKGAAEIYVDISSATKMDSAFRDSSKLQGVYLNAVTKTNTTLADIGNILNGTNGLVNVAFTNVNSTLLTSVNSLFNTKQNLKTIDLTDFHTENVADFGGWLQSCPNVEKITGPYSTLPAAASKGDLEIYVDISSATHMNNAFKNSSSLQGVYLNAVTKKNETLQNIVGMLDGANGLVKVAFTNVDSASLTSVNCLFKTKPNLKTIDLTDFHTENVADFGGWLQDCPVLEKITGPYSTIPGAASKGDLEIYVDISSATHLNNAFAGSASLKGVYLNAATKTNETLTTVNGMLNGTNGLVKAAFTNVNSTQLTSINCLFNSKPELTTLDLTDFHTEHITDFGGAFQNNPKLVSIKGAASTSTAATSEIYLDISSAVTLNSTFKSSPLLTGVYLNAGTKNTTLSSIQDLFNGTSGLVHVAFKNVDSTAITGLNNLFDGKSELVDVDMTGFCTDHVTTMENMFRGCQKLQTVKTSETVLDEQGNPEYAVALKIAAATNIKEMFNNCSKVTGISLSGNGKENDTGLSDISLVFKDCTNLAKVEFKDLKTTALTGYNAIFSGRTKLESVAFTRVAFPSITTMESLFRGCVALKYVNYDDFDTSNVTNMSYMFYDCRSLERVNLSEFKTEHVTTMEGMFGNSTTAGFPDSSLEVLDITSFKTNSLTSIRYMFCRCTALRTIYVDPTQWRSDLIPHDTANSAGGDVFTGCSVLKGLYGTNPVAVTGEAYPVSHPGVSSQYAVADEDGIDLNDHDGPDEKGYFSAKIGTARFKEMSCDKNDDKKLIGYNWPDALGLGKKLDDMSKFTRCTDPTMTEERAKTIGVDLTDDSYVDPVTNNKYKVYGWFEGSVFYWWSEAGTVYINPNTWGMFNFYYTQNTGKKPTELTVVDFQGIDTSQMISFARFFSDAWKLPRIIDESKGGMDYRFKMNTTTKDMKQMFSGCHSLVSFDLSAVDTSAVTHMNQMFCDTASLTSIDISNFDSTSLVDATQMFNMRNNKYKYYQGNVAINVDNQLTSITFGEKFKCLKVNSMKQMFMGCRYLTELDLQYFDTSKTHSTVNLNTENMFNDCKNLVTIKVTDPDQANGEGFYGPGTGSYQSRINSSGNMFASCPALRGGKGDSVTSLGKNDATYAHVGRYAHDGLSEQSGLFTAD